MDVCIKRENETKITTTTTKIIRLLLELKSNQWVVLCTLHMFMAFIIYAIISNLSLKSEPFVRSHLNVNWRHSNDFAPLSSEARHLGHNKI